MARLLSTPQNRSLRVHVRRGGQEGRNDGTGEIPRCSGTASSPGQVAVLPKNKLERVLRHSITLYGSELCGVSGRHVAAKKGHVSAVHTAL